MLGKKASSSHWPRKRISSRQANSIQSWNVYNAENIARVKADEAAAAARDAAEEQHIQQIDAARRAALLRGETPPSFPEERTYKNEQKSVSRRDSHNGKRRKLAGEDDTDRDIRLASSVTRPLEESHETDSRVMKLRQPASDAPLTDYAGNINLFPVDLKEQVKREKNEEAERNQRKKERASEDQYAMRFSDAAGRRSSDNPWYTSGEKKPADSDHAKKKPMALEGFESKDVWGNEDPLRKERELARISANDPLVIMQRGYAQMEKAKQAKRKRAEEQALELKRLKTMHEEGSLQERDRKSKEYKDGNETFSAHRERHGRHERHERHERNERHGGKERHERKERHEHKGRHERHEHHEHHERHERHEHHNRDGSSRHKRRHRTRSHSREGKHEYSSSHRYERHESHGYGRERD